jgi:DNA-binding NtrC family response regulator
MALQTKGSILIVDDQENWCKLLTRVLGTDYKVHAVSNAQEAEQVLLSSTFNVVILDVRLVDRDSFNVSGIALLKKIKEQQPNTGVIMLTGYPDDVRPEIIEKYCADAFMLKAPEGSKFNISEFKAVVQDLVTKYRKHD